MIEIKVESSEVTAAFNRLLALGEDMTPVMRAISETLKDRTEQNFADQSGPLGAWPALSEATLKIKAKHGKTSPRMLQDTGRLATSITAAYDDHSAMAGTNVIYAAIQQFGGITSPRSMIPNKAIPPRP